MSRAYETYSQILSDRREGRVSQLGEFASFTEVKPEFYADSNLLAREVLKTFRAIRASNPPYGLVDYAGKPVTTLQHNQRSPWLVLEAGLSSTMLTAYNLTRPPVDQCPYAGVLTQKLGVRALTPLVGYHPDLDTLREVSAPGGVLAPGLIVPLLSRIPAIASFHGAKSSYKSLATLSARNLLQSPLSHAQQHAKAFVFCLTGETKGDITFDRESFLPTKLIAEYTKIETNPVGHEQIQWALPTSDFRLQTGVHVVSRVASSEQDRSGKNGTFYPAGTRLGDIKTDEPTIGCPGKIVAYALYGAAVSIIIQEQLWTSK